MAMVFLVEGADKFSNSRLWIRVFNEIGWGQWFRYFTGAVEIAGALLLLVPLTAWVGAALLMCTMLGALLVHLGARRHAVDRHVQHAARSHNREHHLDRLRDGEQHVFFGLGRRLCVSLASSANKRNVAAATAAAAARTHAHHTTTKYTRACYVTPCLQDARTGE